MRRGASQALEDDSEVESAVEEVLDLAKVSMRVLAESEGVVRASQRSLDVAHGRVHGKEGRVLGAGCAATSDVRLVQDAGALYDSEAAQAVGDQGSRSGQRRGSKGLNRVFGKGALRQAHQDRLTGLGGLHRSHEGDLVGRTAAGLAALDLTTQVGVVDLDPACQLAPLLPKRHHAA